MLDLCIIEDLKIYDKNKLEKLNLFKFIFLIMILRIINSFYANWIAVNYY